MNERMSEAVGIDDAQLRSVGVLGRAGAPLVRALGAATLRLKRTQVAADILGLLMKRRDLHEVVNAHDPLLISVWLRLVLGLSAAKPTL